MIDLSIIRKTQYAVWWTLCLILCASFGRNAFAQDASSIVAWGDNSNGQTNVPPGLTNIVGVSISYTIGMALNANGLVTVWGSDNVGQTNLPAGLSNVVSIAADADHCLALKSDGTLVAWGENNFGQTNIPLGLSNVVAIAAGDGVSVALQNNGLVTAWGDPFEDTTNVPVSLSNVVAIAESNNGGFGLALTADGSVTAWGTAPYGQTDYPPGLTNVVSIAADGYFCLAARSDGSVLAWGTDPFCTNLPSGLTNVAAVCAGDSFGAALKEDGTVSIWGYNWSLGVTQIPSGLTNVLAITGGYDDAMAMVGNEAPVVLPFANEFAYSGAGTVIIEANVLGRFPLSYQWQFDGTNILGANKAWLVLTNIETVNAGDYTIVVTNVYGVASNTAPLMVANSAPVIIQQPQSIQLPPNNYVSLSVSANGSQPITYQWQFDGTNIPNATSALLIMTNAQLSSAGMYSVVLNNPYGTLVSSNVALTFSVSSVAAWGRTIIGTGSFQFGTPPGLINVIAISASQYDDAVVLANDTVEVWGDNSAGQTNIPPGVTNIVGIAEGNYDLLALKSDGTVIAWGDDTYGQTNVPLCVSNVAAISAGPFADYALTSNGTVVAWGSNSLGGVYTSPAPPDGLSNVMAIAAGYCHCVALRSDGSVVAWGDNTDGQTNVPASLTNVIAIGAGNNAFGSLAIKSDHTIVYWGVQNDGTPPNNLNLTNVIAGAMGGHFGLALLADGTVVAWGDDTFNETNIPSHLANVTAISAGYVNSLVLDPAGGVITLDPSRGAGTSQIGYLLATLSPPLAVAAGAGWGILGQPYFSSNTNFTVPVTSAQPVELAFQAAPGWIVPTSRAVTVPMGGATNLNISYSVPPPMLSANALQGLGILGTSNATYEIDARTNLAGGAWLPLQTNTIGSGINYVLRWPPTNASTIFYRAVWLP